LPSCFILTIAPFMTTPLMGWLLVNSLVDAYELENVALVKTTARRKVKIIPLLAKIKTMGIRVRMI
jgi:hypothetical protein